MFIAELSEGILDSGGLRIMYSGHRTPNLSSLEQRNWLLANHCSARDRFTRLRPGGRQATLHLRSFDMIINVIKSVLFLQMLPLTAFAGFRACSHKLHILSTNLPDHPQQASS